MDRTFGMISQQNSHELLIKLIDIPSISSDENAVCTFVFDLLKTMSFDTVQRIPVDEHGFNIFATKGVPKVLLQAHLDVVPPHIPSRVDETKIYGRGSCDTKASAACMIVAAQQALADGLTNFGVVFTVREETSMVGIKKLVSALPQIPFTIVGEPSRLQPVTSHFGMLTLNLETKGKAAHTSQAGEGVNAIDALIKAAADLQSIKIHPDSMLSVVKIEGGVASNIVPPLAKARYSFRISPDDKNDYLEMFTKVLKNHPLATVTKGFEAGAVKSKLPSELSFLGKGQTVKYFTELSFLQSGVILGPGDIIHAHTDIEQVQKKELDEAVLLYGKILVAMAN